MSAASSASTPDNAPKRPREGGGTLASRITQRYAKLPPDEWDFRWIATKEESGVVASYELGREVLRLANYELNRLDGKEALAELNPSLQQFACKGCFAELDTSRGYPDQPGVSLGIMLRPVASYWALVKWAPVMPPPAVSIRTWVKKRAKGAKATPEMIIQSQEELPWVPDEEDDIPPSHASALLGWHDLDPGAPCWEFRIHLPIFEQMTHAEAQRQFAKWVRSQPGLFVGSGREPVPVIVKLAFFRYTQGRPGLKLFGQMQQYFTSKSSKPMPNGYGRTIFRHVETGAHAGARVQWSRALKELDAKFAPYVATLVSMVRDRTSPQKKFIRPAGVKSSLPPGFKRDQP
jgi:hypothetical protein